MNEKRRKQLIKSAALLSEAADFVLRVMDEERDAFCNLPVGLQESERGIKMEQTVDALDDVLSLIDSAGAVIRDVL